MKVQPESVPARGSSCPRERASYGRVRSFRRRFVVLAVALFLVFPAIAYAWEQPYVSGQAMQPGGFQYSAWNSGINFNKITWNNQYGGTNTAQLTLCDGGGSCYPYSGSDDMNHTDLRSISYGRAKCQSKNDNFYYIYVYECYARN